MFGSILAALAVSAGLATGAQTEPPAPSKNDYWLQRSWLCRPDMTSGPCRDDAAVTVIAADGRTKVEPLKPDPDAPIDCFYVYPTISRDPGVLSDMTPGPEETGVARVQAAPFASLCRVYAPMYRQATIASMRIITRPETGRGKATRMSATPGTIISPTTMAAAASCSSATARARGSSCSC
jgi:hypothetical protein